MDEWTWRFSDQVPFDAIHIASQDLAFMNDIVSGKSEIKTKDLQKRKNLISSNLSLRDNKIGPLWNSILYLKKEVPGLNRSMVTAVLGLTDTRNPLSHAMFVAEDAATALPRRLAELQKGVDLVVLLTDIPTIDLKELIRKNPGIDLAIVSNHGGALNPAERIEDTAIVESFDQGKYLGEMALYLDRQAQLVRIRNRFVELNASVPNPMSLTSLAQEAEQSMANIRMQLHHRTEH